MISLLTGSILDIMPNSILIENKGIGFELTVINPSQFQKAQTVTMYVYLHWSQEQGPTLFGFNSSLEKSTFMLIISCSGIGPKIALGILSHLEPSVFLQIITNQDITGLSSAPGIGAKKAEQMIVSLKHKVDTLLTKHPELTQTTSLGIWKDLTDTLQSLNYSAQEIKAATNHIKKIDDYNNLPFDMILRKSLTFLAKK
jgi:Holliday junction DNA helicase RuvA